MPTPKVSPAARRAIGKRIAEAREGADLSQGALAEVIGLNRTAVVHMESGRNMPSLQVAAAIAAACRVSIDFIWGRKPQ